MKIVAINSVSYGSTGKIMLAIAEESRKQGIEYYTFSGAGNKNIKGHKVLSNKYISALDYYVSKFISFHGCGSVLPTLKLLYNLNKIKPDIIHLHNLHGWYYNIYMLFHWIKRHNIKIIWTLHDCWAFTGHCAHFDLVNCNKWQEGCYKCPCLKNYPYAKFDFSDKQYIMKKKLFNDVKNMTIIAPSHWLANLIKKSYLNNYEIRIINNGIDLTNFTYLDNHNFDSLIDRTKKIILGVANPFGVKKGFKDFIKLSNILPEYFQIVMVGLNNEQIKNLPNNIIGIKNTNNQKELAELYSIATVFLNLTYEDIYSMTNIEALACGIPVICYNTGGAVEMLNTNNSFIVEKGNIKEIYEKIKNLSSTNFNKRLISKNTKEKHSQREMADKYIELYNLQ